MPSPSSGKKISLSVTNWLLGGSLINVEREGNNDRRVSNKVAIKVDALGNKVYADGTVKKKEKPVEPKPEPKLEVKKAEERPKETGILKKSKTKGGDEEEEVTEKSCCGKCGKSIKSKGDAEKCKKHSGKDDTKDGSKEKTEDESKESKAESKNKPKADTKDENNNKKDNKSESKQKTGKGGFTWTHDLDKQLQEMFAKKTPWPEILSTIRTNRKNCDQRLEYLEGKGEDKDDAAAIKAKNDATEAALYANVPTTDTNPGFGTGFDASIFSSDFGGDPQKKKVKSSWDVSSFTPASNSWGTVGKTGDEKQIASGWGSTGDDKQQPKWDVSKSNEKTAKPAAESGWNADPKPDAAWGSHDAATHTVDVPPAQSGWNGDAPAVSENTKGEGSWATNKAADTRSSGGWGEGSGGTTWGDQKPQEKKDDTPKSAEAKTSAGGSNDDNPHAEKSDATDAAAACNGWGGCDDITAQESASTGEGWGVNSGGAAAGEGGAWGSSGSKSMPGSWNNSDESKFQDNSGNAKSAGGWGTTGKPQERTGGDSAWDNPCGQSDGNLAPSAPATTSWDAPPKGSSVGDNAAPASGSNGGSNAQSTHTWGGDGTNDQKPAHDGWNSGWGNSQGSQSWNGNGLNTWGNSGQGSTPPNDAGWGGNNSSKFQGSPAQSTTGCNSDNPHVLKSHVPVSSNSGNNHNASNGSSRPPNQGGWGGNSGNNNPSNNPNSSNFPPNQGNWNGDSGNNQQRTPKQGGNNLNNPPPSQKLSGGFQGQSPTNNDGNFQGSDPNITGQIQSVVYKSDDGGTWLFFPNNSGNGKNDPRGPSPPANNGQGGQPKNGSGNNHQQDTSGDNRGPLNRGPLNQGPRQSGPPPNGNGNYQHGPPRNFNCNQGGQYQNGPSQNWQNAGLQNNLNGEQGNHWQNSPIVNSKDAPGSGNGYNRIPNAPQSSTENQTALQNTYECQIINGPGGYWIRNHPAPAQNTNVGYNQGDHWQPIAPKQNDYQGGPGPFQSANNVPAVAWMNFGPPPPIGGHQGEPKPTNSATQPPKGSSAYSHSLTVNDQAAPPINTHGNWVWQEATGPQRQTQKESCGHSHVLNGNYSQTQPASTHCHHTHATPPQKLNDTGRWVWETTRVNPQAQVLQPPYPSNPCFHQTAYLNPLHTPFPPPGAPKSPQWIGAGMNNPHWQPRSQDRCTSAGIPQPQHASPDPRPKHVHFPPIRSNDNFHPSSVAGQDIWSSCRLQPVHDRTPAPSYGPLHSAFGDSNRNGYAYNAPGAFPTSPGPGSQATATAASKPSSGEGW